MPLPADLFGLCGRGPDPARTRCAAAGWPRGACAVATPAAARATTRSRRAPDAKAPCRSVRHDRTEVSRRPAREVSTTASTGRAVAASISPSLAKKAPAGQARRRAARPRPPAAARRRDRDRHPRSPEALDIIRHDTAHVLAEAVQELFPGTQVTIGPNVEDGFYYDFARDEPFSPGRPAEDRSSACARSSTATSRSRREVWDRDEAIAHFKGIGEAYKAEIIEGIPGDEPITVYRQGDWKDLCRGPHLPSTRHVGKAFKLTKLAGAYWRGDQRNAQLQRIYGTAWAVRGRPRRLPEAHRGGREARPPQARRGHGPLPHPGRGPGHGLLASRRAGRSTGRWRTTCAGGSRRPATSR